MNSALSHDKREFLNKKEDIKTINQKIYLMSLNPKYKKDYVNNSLLSNSNINKSKSNTVYLTTDQSINHLKTNTSNSNNYKNTQESKTSQNYKNKETIKLQLLIQKEEQQRHKTQINQEEKKRKLLVENNKIKIKNLKHNKAVEMKAYSRLMKENIEILKNKIVEENKQMKIITKTKYSILQESISQYKTIKKKFMQDLLLKDIEQENKIIEEKTKILNELQNKALKHTTTDNIL